MPCADCNVNFCIPNNTKMTTITQRRIASRRYDPPPFSATLRDAFMWVTPSFRLISAGAHSLQPLRTGNAVVTFTYSSPAHNDVHVGETFWRSGKAARSYSIEIEA